MDSTAPTTIPRPALEAIGRSRPLRFSGAEQRVVLGLLLLPTPLSAWQLARWLNRPYEDTKRVVRGLVAFGVVRRTAAGLIFEPDPKRWLTAKQARLAAAARATPPEPALSARRGS
jgi:hypothetical protein